MLYGQAVASLQPPGLEDLSSSLGFHPRPESVHALPPPHFGLPRSFRHSDTSPVRITAGNYTRFFPSLQICGNVSEQEVSASTASGIAMPAVSSLHFWRF
jgi:hypothetical protein